MPAKPKRNGAERSDTVYLLEEIKKLMILQLLAGGVPSLAIAEALSVDKSVISRLVSARKLQRQLKKP